MKKDFKKDFMQSGYCIVQLFNKSEIKKFNDLVVKRVNQICVGSKNFNLSSFKNFHKEQIPENIRSKIVNPSTRYVRVNTKKLFSKKTKNKIKALMQEFWGHNQGCVYWVGSAKRKEIKLNSAGFRLVRPQKKQDGGVEHIDAYSTDLKSFFTIWIPLVGHGKKYTLKVAPKSHLILKNSNDYKKNNKYVSRAFKRDYIKKFQFIRPNLKIGQAIIHHPNTIHGGNVNLGKFTRVSLEIRFFDKLKFNLKKTFDNKLVN